LQIVGWTLTNDQKFMKFNMGINREHITGDKQNVGNGGVVE
jgi:hypothetical protein